MWKRVLPRAAPWSILFVLLQWTAPRCVEVELESLQKSEKSSSTSSRIWLLRDEGASLAVVELHWANIPSQWFQAEDKVRLYLSLFDPLP